MAPISNRRGSHIKDVRRAGRVFSTGKFSSSRFPVSEPITITNGPEVLDESSLGKSLVSEEVGQRTGRFLGRLCEAGSDTREVDGRLLGTHRRGLRLMGGRNSSAQLQKEKWLILIPTAGDQFYTVA
jgi:hypothetical protein